MVSVNIDTTVAEFESRRDDMKALKTALDSLASDYNTSIASINNAISAITFDHWEDAISTILKSVVEYMRSHVDTISKDISSGGFLALQKTSDNLSKQLDACAKEKKRLEELKVKLEDIKANHYYIQSGNNKIKNPQIDVLERQITLLKNSLENKVNRCNDLFEFLAEIEFNPKTPYTIPDVDTTEANLSPNTSPNTVPNTSPNTVPNTSPNTVPNTSPNTVPNTGPNTGPNANTSFWETGFGQFAASMLFGPLKLIEGVGTAVENVIIDPAARLFGHKEFADRDLMGEAFDGEIYANAWGGKDSAVNQVIGSFNKNLGKAATYFAGGVGLAALGPVLGITLPASAAAIAATGLATAGGISAGVSKSYRENNKLDFSTIAFTAAGDVINQLFFNPVAPVLGNTAVATARSVAAGIGSSSIRDIVVNSSRTFTGHILSRGARPLILSGSSLLFTSRITDFLNRIT